LITYNPEDHTYWNEFGVQYISATTLLGKEYPFDSDSIAEKVRKIPSSRYSGMSKERILSLWENSSGHGSTLHEAIERYIKHDEWPSDTSLVPLVKQFSKLNFRGDLLSEVIVWDDDVQLAGTADILEVFPDKIYLYDIKTSNRVSDDKLMKFSLQLELYKRMIEGVFKKPTYIASILWFEDYVVKRSTTKLKLFRTLECSKVVDEILEKRRNEICQQRQ